MTWVLTFCDKDGKLPTRQEFALGERTEAITAFYTALDSGATNLYLTLIGELTTPVLIHPGVRK